MFKEQQAGDIRRDQGRKEVGGDKAELCGRVQGRGVVRKDPSGCWEWQVGYK